MSGVLLQDDTLAAQAALEKQLGAVGDDVEETSRQVAEVHSSVKELENNLDDIATKQQYANEGIYLLCRRASLCMLFFFRFFVFPLYSSAAKPETFTCMHAGWWAT